MVTDSSSSSGFIDAATYSAEWTDVQQLQRRSHNIIYIASRYGRRFLLKGLTPEAAQLSDYRLLQEKEFRLGISVVHPHIATTYAFEEVEPLGRCIVQEYIDGLPLAQWLETTPSAPARERVLDQLLDALDYLHQQQLVHHDLKSGNILVTRNGANVKLIDFGLSDTDDSLSPAGNDPQTDIAAVGGLLLQLFPHRYRMIARRCRQGKYASISAVRKAVARHRRWRRIFPTIVLVLAAVCLALGLQANRQSLEEQRREQMRERVTQHIALAEQELEQLVARYNTYDLEAALAFSEYTRRSWVIGDSLADLYPPDDPLHDEAAALWNTRFTRVYTRYALQLENKSPYRIGPNGTIETLDK